MPGDLDQRGKSPDQFSITHDGSLRVIQAESRGQRADGREPRAQGRGQRATTEGRAPKGLGERSERWIIPKIINLSLPIDPKHESTISIFRKFSKCFGVFGLTV